MIDLRSDTCSRPIRGDETRDALLCSHNSRHASDGQAQVTNKWGAVTAEAAGSSPVVPAIHFKVGVIPHRAKKFALRGARLVAVFLRVSIECRLNLRMTQ